MGSGGKGAERPLSGLWGNGVGTLGARQSGLGIPACWPFSTWTCERDPMCTPAGGLWASVRAHVCAYVRVCALPGGAGVWGRWVCVCVCESAFIF